MAAPIYIPTNSAGGLPFLYILANTCYLLSFFLIYFIFIYFWLCWAFVAARGLSPVAESGGHSSLQCTGFSLRWLLLLQSMGSRCTGFSSRGVQAQQLWLAGSRAQARQLWPMGPVALRHMGSSWTRARTHVPCVGRQTPNHCATREALVVFLMKAILTDVR